MRVKSRSCPRLHLDQRLDDLEHVAAGAEIAAGAGDDERFDGLLLRRRAEQVDELRVALEGERILLIRPVEGDGGDLAVDRQANMARLVGGKRQRDRIGCAHRGAPLPIALRAEALVLARSRISVSISSRGKIGQNVGDPVAVRACHRAEEASPLGGQAHELRAPVLGRGPAADEALLDQAVDQSGDVAVRDHHALRQLAQRHRLRRAVELRHQIEARQRDVEAVAQAPTDLALDHLLAGEQPQPQAQLVLVIVRPFGDLGLGVEWCGALLHHISPPAMASVVPVTAAASGEQR